MDDLIDVIEVGAGVKDTVEYTYRMHSDWTKTPTWT